MVDINYTNYNNKNINFRANILKDSHFKELESLAKKYKKEKEFSKALQVIDSYPSFIDLEIRMPQPKGQTLGAIKFKDAPLPSSKAWLMGRGQLFKGFSFDTKDSGIILYRSHHISYKNDLKDFLQGFCQLGDYKSKVSECVFKNSKILFPIFEYFELKNRKDTKSPLYNKYKNDEILVQNYIFEAPHKEKVFQATHIIDFLQSEINANPNYTSEDAYSFLIKTINDKELAPKVVKDLSKIIYKHAEYEEFLKNILGDESRLKIWLNDSENGYLKAYSDYYKTEIWDKAKSFEDLVVFSPNIAPWKLEKLKKERNFDIKLGELPREDFKNINVYTELISQIRTKTGLQDSENNLENFIISIDNNGFKTNFEVEPITNGQSGTKNVFRIRPYNAGMETYILKISPEVLNKKFHKNIDLTPDSIYINSLMDYYLKRNGCSNVADFLYFDYELQASLYRETKGTTPTGFEKFFSNLQIFRTINGISGVYELGVTINDAKSDNFIINKYNEIKLIDSGHCSYKNPFRPPIPGYHFTSGNLCGREGY